MSYVYWCVLLSVSILGFLAEKNPKVRKKLSGEIVLGPDTGAAIILSLILILVAGLRYRVGTDYFSYFYRRVPEWERVWKDLIGFKEGGFSLLIKLSRMIYDHEQTLIFISALITVGLFCWTIFNHHAFYLVSILIYILSGEWQESFNGIRQCIAAAIVFSGHRFILDKKYCQYCLVVFIAFLFHATAIVMIIPCFVMNRKADITQLFILAICAVVIRFSYQYIFRVIENYKDKTLNLQRGYLSHSVSLLRVLVTFVPVLIYIFLCDKQNQTKEQNFYINSLFFNAFSMLAGMGSAYFGRVGIYTGAVATIGYGYLFQLIKDEKTRKIIMFAVVAMYLVYWIYSLEGIENFQWIFEREM